MSDETPIYPLVSVSSPAQANCGKRQTAWHGFVSRIPGRLQPYTGRCTLETEQARAVLAEVRHLFPPFFPTEVCSSWSVRKPESTHASKHARPQASKQVRRQEGRREEGREARKEGSKEAGKQGSREAGKPGSREAGKQGSKNTRTVGSRKAGRDRQAGKQGSKQAAQANPKPP